MVSYSSNGIFNIGPLSLVLGVVTTILIYYFVGRNRPTESRFLGNLQKTRTTFGILFSDFWFDGFFVRKVVSLIYSLTLILFYSTIWDTFLGFNSSNGLIRVVLILLFVIGVRVVLESVISLIKISENSSVIKELLIGKEEEEYVPQRIRRDQSSIEVND